MAILIEIAEGIDPERAEIAILQTLERLGGVRPAAYTADQTVRKLTMGYSAVLTLARCQPVPARTATPRLQLVEGGRAL
jgi:hypothetical protein